MNEFLIVFASGYFSVFLLGFQSRLVNTGNYLWSAACSFTIAMFQASLWSNLMSKDHTFAGTLAYGVAGAAAITSAIFVHQKLFPKAFNK